MTERELHHLLTLTEIGLAAVTVFAVWRWSAPYGRHIRSGWGPTVSSRAAWIVMELPAAVVFAAVYLQGDERARLAPMLLAGLWQLHYLQRSLVYPLRMRAPAKRVPLLVPVLGLLFNVLNGYVNARFVSQFGSYPDDWLSDGRFVAGSALFLGGYSLNLWADERLRRLRPPGETGYRVPSGGMFGLVSCPNYLGEIIEWCGWALASWSLPGLAFALFTIANLTPRALDHHRWYRSTFPDYPSRRRALVPFVL